MKYGDRVFAWLFVGYGLHWATRGDWTGTWGHLFALSLGAALVLFGVRTYMATVEVRRGQAQGHPHPRPRQAALRGGMAEARAKVGG